VVRSATHMGFYGRGCDGFPFVAAFSCVTSGVTRFLNHLQRRPPERERD